MDKDDEKRLEEIKKEHRKYTMAYCHLYGEDIDFLLDLVERLELLNSSLEDIDKAWVNKGKQLRTKLNQYEDIIEKMDKIPFSYILSMCENFTYSNDTTEADAQYSINDNIKETIIALQQAVEKIRSE